MFQLVVPTASGPKPMFSNLGREAKSPARQRRGNSRAVGASDQNQATQGL